MQSVGFISCLMFPHFEQIFDERSNLPVSLYSFTLYNALVFSIAMNDDHTASAMFLGKWCFFIILLMFRSSAAIASKFLVYQKLY